MDFKFKDINLVYAVRFHHVELGSLNAVEMNAGLNCYIIVGSALPRIFRKTKASPSVIYQAFLEATYTLGPVLGPGGYSDHKHIETPLNLKVC